MRPFVLFAGAVVTFSLGCATATVAVDGRNLNEFYWQSARQKLGPQASFALNCPEDQLQWKVLDVMPDLTGDVATVVGISGCDQRITYRNVSQVGWVAETASSGTPQP